MPYEILEEDQQSAPSSGGYEILGENDPQTPSPEPTGIAKVLDAVANRQTADEERRAKRAGLQSQMQIQRAIGTGGRMAEGALGLAERGAYTVADALAGMDMTGLTRQSMAANGYRETQPLVSPQNIKDAASYLVDNPIYNKFLANDVNTVSSFMKQGIPFLGTTEAGQIGEGLGNAGAGLVSGFTGKDVAPLIVTGMVTPIKAVKDAVQKAFTTQMVRGAPDAIIGAHEVLTNPDATLAQKVQAGAEGLGGVVFPIAAGHHAYGSAEPSMVIPSRNAWESTTLAPDRSALGILPDNGLNPNSVGQIRPGMSGVNFNQGYDGIQGLGTGQPGMGPMRFEPGPEPPPPIKPTVENIPRTSPEEMAAHEAEIGRAEQQLTSPKVPLEPGAELQTWDDYVTALQRAGRPDMTKAEIQGMFPQQGVSREAAKQLAEAAWGDKWAPGEKKQSSPAQSAGVTQPLPTEAAQPKEPNGQAQEVQNQEVLSTVPDTQPGAATTASGWITPDEWAKLPKDQADKFERQGDRFVHKQNQPGYEILEPETQTTTTTTETQNADTIGSPGGDTIQPSGVEAPGIEQPGSNQGNTGVSVQSGTGTVKVQTETPGAGFTLGSGVKPEQASAVQKMSDQVVKLKNLRGTDPAKEVKSKLVAKLEEAVAQAPAEADVPAGGAKKISFHIPGDGTFTLTNTKENIQGVLDSARRIKAGGSEKVPVPQTHFVDSKNRAAREISDAIAVYGTPERAIERLAEQLARAEELGIGPAQQSRITMLINRLSGKMNENKTTTKPASVVAEDAKASNEKSTAKTNTATETASGDAGEVSRLEQSLREVPGFENLPEGSLRLARPDEVKRSPGMVAAHAIGKIFGKRIVVFKSDHPTGPQIMGFASDSGKILINADAIRPHFAVVGHELIHRMKVEHPDIYDALVSNLDPLLKRGWKSSVWEGYDKDVRKEEFVANFAGDNILDPKVLGALAENVPGIAGKAAKFIIDNLGALISKLRADGWGSSKWVKELETAKDHLAKSLGEYAKRNTIDSQGMERNVGEGLGPDMTTSWPPSKEGDAGAALNSAGPDPVLVSDLNKSNIPVAPDGGLNAGVVNYSIADLPKWSEDFSKDERARKLFGKEAVDDILGAMRYNAAILGGQHPVFDFKTSPLRGNMDFGSSFDLSTICGQQDLYISTLNALETANGNIYSPQQRFLIGEMMKDMGLAPACFYCYGQAGRDVFEHNIELAARVFNRVADKFASGEVKGDADITSEMGTWQQFKKSTDKKTGKVVIIPGLMLKTLKQMGEQASKSGYRIDALRIRDIVDGKLEPANAFEDQLAKNIGGWSQAASLRNAPKGAAAYTDQFLTAQQKNIDAQNRAYGQRMNSQTDLRPWHVVDVAQAFAHLGIRKGLAHVYSRKNAMLDIFGDTGLKINMSCEYAHNPDGSLMRDQNGSPMWDGMNGMSREDALRYREKHPNAGSMLVAMNEPDLLVAFSDANIDQIIPLHLGKVSKFVASYMNAVDFSKQQHEKFPSDWPEFRKVKVRNKDGSVALNKDGSVKTTNVGVSRIAVLDDGSRVEVTRGRPITREHHLNNKDRYLEICDKLGIKPRFAQYRDNPGYMKVVQDIARVDTPHTPVDVTKMNWEAANQFVSDWLKKGGMDFDNKPNQAVISLIQDRIDRNDWPESHVVMSDKARANYENGHPGRLSATKAALETEKPTNGNPSGEVSVRPVGKKTKAPLAVAPESERFGIDHADLDSKARELLQKARPSTGGKFAIAPQEPKLSMADRAAQIVGAAKDVRRTVRAMWDTGTNNSNITSSLDGAENQAGVAGKRAATWVYGELARAFGEKSDSRNAVRENALTFMVESGAATDPANAPAILANWEVMVKGGKTQGIWERKAVQAIKYAQAHFAEMQPVAQLYHTITETEHAAENAAGVVVLHRKGGYVFHAQDVPGNFAFPDTGSGGGSPSGPFRKIREFNNYADSIASGVHPVTLSAVDLMQHRITAGQRMLNHAAWVEGLRRMVDPTTGTPLMVDLVTKTRADGTTYIDVPTAEYNSVSFGGKEFGLHKGYQGIFNDLTDPSWFSRDPIRKGLLKAAATSKHVQLLFDTFHFGRLAFWNGFSRFGAPTFNEGLSLLDSPIENIRAMAARGEIPASWVADAAKRKQTLSILMDAGLNTGKVADNLHAEWVQKLPLAGTFNKWLFEKYQRGAMAEVSLVEFDRQRNLHPGESMRQTARRVAKDVNTRFGSLGSQGLFRSKTGQDLARMIFLAPQWNEGLIRSELGAVVQVIKAPFDVAAIKQGIKTRTLPVGMLGRSVATAALATFVANQIINLMTRGKPTWENDEEDPGAKISAWLPDLVGHGPGLFLNPMAIPLEISHLFMKGMERTGDATQTTREFLRGRLNSVGKAINTFWNREDQLGKKLRTGSDVAVAAAGSLVPVPISAGAVGRAAKQMVTGQREEAFQGQFEKQILQSFGVKTDNAPGAEQRIQRLAMEWRREQPGYKPNPEFYGSDYDGLKKALRMGNMRDAKIELSELRLKKTDKAILTYFKSFARHPFTGSHAGEVKFLDELTDAQRNVYEAAREERNRIREVFMDLFSEGN